MTEHQERTLTVMLTGCYNYKVAYRDDDMIYISADGTTLGKNISRINASGTVTPLNFSTIQKAEVE